MAKKNIGLMLVGFIFSCSLFYTKARAKDNHLSILEYDKLKEVKEEIDSSKFSPLYTDLLKSANIALEEGTFSVMEKTQTPTCGTKHDYISLGPYWWPDPNMSDGLQWIRKNGEINPLTRQGV